MRPVAMHQTRLPARLWRSYFAAWEGACLLAARVSAASFYAAMTYPAANRSPPLPRANPFRVALHETTDKKQRKATAQTKPQRGARSAKIIAHPTMQKTAAKTKADDFIKWRKARAAALQSMQVADAEALERGITEIDLSKLG